jgi:ectoine hydroxylase-related dioxygenase (phytanoyl-CoA dioxygenase family)
MLKNYTKCYEDFFDSKSSNEIIDNSVSEIQLNGYAIIKKGIPEDLIVSLIEKIKFLDENIPKPNSDLIPRLNQGHKIVYSLENKHLIFTKAMVSHPIVQKVLQKLLNDKWYKQIPEENPNYILRAMIARTGGKTMLPLHIDSFIPSSGDTTFVMQVAFILENQNIENGCTFCVPGSHKYDRYATQEDMNYIIPLPSERGDIVIWDSRLFHGAYENKSDKTRWSFIGTFTRWWIKQNYSTVLNVPDSIFNNLTDIEKSILGFCCTPPLNEYERIDIKAGYELNTRKANEQKK